MVELGQITEASSCWVCAFKERLWTSDSGSVRPSTKDCMRPRLLTARKDNGRILTVVKTLRECQQSPVVQGTSFYRCNSDEQEEIYVKREIPMALISGILRLDTICHLLEDTSDRELSGKGRCLMTCGVEGVCLAEGE